MFLASFSSWAVLLSKDMNHQTAPGTPTRVKRFAPLRCRRNESAVKQEQQSSSRAVAREVEMGSCSPDVASVTHNQINKRGINKLLRGTNPHSCTASLRQVQN
jgi:hypothetical protein